MQEYDLRVATGRLRNDEHQRGTRFPVPPFAVRMAHVLRFANDPMIP